MRFLVHCNPKYKELRLLEETLEKATKELEKAKSMLREYTRKPNTDNPEDSLRIRMELVHYLFKCADEVTKLKESVCVCKKDMDATAYAAYLEGRVWFDELIEAMAKTPSVHPELTAIGHTPVQKLEIGKCYACECKHDGAETNYHAVYLLEELFNLACVGYQGAIYGVNSDSLFEISNQ
jgi:hypothetical protein